MSVVVRTYCAKAKLEVQLSVAIATSEEAVRLYESQHQELIRIRFELKTWTEVSQWAAL